MVQRKTSSHVGKTLVQLQEMARREGLQLAPGVEVLPVSRIGKNERQLEFDRASNPIVPEVTKGSPELFEGWTEEDWNELYSQFGMGGSLTEHGVREVASRINQKRELCYKLSVLLETHLSESASVLIDALYRTIRGPVVSRERGWSPPSLDRPRPKQEGA